MDSLGNFTWNDGTEKYETLKDFHTFQEKNTPNLNGYKVKSAHTHCTIIPDHMLKKVIDKHRTDCKEHKENIELKNLHHGETVRKLRKNYFVKHEEILSDGQPLSVYSMGNSSSDHRLPGSLKRNSDKPYPRDNSVNHAYDGTKNTYEFYWQIFKRHSIDDKKMPIVSAVHYGHGYNNAFWNGKYMVFGDGDGQIFGDFTVPQDVTAHELTHGVSQYSVAASHMGDGLGYEGETGGINEAISDIFGTMVKQWGQKQDVSHADWKIGIGLLLSQNGHVYALRDMLNPGQGYVNHPVLGTDPQIWRYSDYVELAKSSDVDPHISSGIMNKAFALAAKELENPSGHSWDRLGPIFYDALKSFVPEEVFNVAADKTVLSAQKLYGKGGAEEKALRNAWGTVEVKISV